MYIEHNIYFFKYIIKTYRDAAIRILPFRLSTMVKVTISLHADANAFMQTVYNETDEIM